MNCGTWVTKGLERKIAARRKIPGSLRFRGAVALHLEGERGCALEVKSESVVAM